MTQQYLTDKIEVFFRQYSYFENKKGKILISAIDKPREVRLLIEGEVKQYAVTKEGIELLFTIYKPGSFFPMMEMSSIPNWYYFETITDVKGWAAPRDKVIEFIKKNPEILFDLLSRVYKGVDGLFLRMQYLMSGTAYTKLISILLICAKRFGNTREDGVEIHLRLTHRDLASLAGVSRETVSREMARLKEQKLIYYTASTITIRTLTALEKRLGR